MKDKSVRHQIGNRNTKQLVRLFILLKLEYLFIILEQLDKILQFLSSLMAVNPYKLQTLIITLAWETLSKDISRPMWFIKITDS